MLALAAVHWAPTIRERAVLVYYQRQCLRYAAPAERVVCIEPGGQFGPPPGFSFQAPDPAPWTSLRPLVEASVLPEESGPILFMHERRCPGGRRFLVVVRRMPPALRQSIDLPLSFCVMLIDPDRAAANKAGAVTRHGCIDVFRPNSPVRFFAGQPDPLDESHFTIRYQTDDGGRGTIEGRVTEVPSPRLELEDLTDARGASH